MAILGDISKQPEEILDFDISYATVMEIRGDTLASATATVSPAGLTIVATTVNPTTSRTNVRFSSGTNAIDYKVTVQTTTTSGLKYEDEVMVHVLEV